MKCPKCKETMIFDTVSDTYYCEQCSVLYDKEELENKPKGKILFLSLLMWIPLVNIVLITLIEKSDIEDRNVYYNVFLSSLMLHMVLFMLAGFSYKWYVDTKVRFARQTLESAFDTIAKEDDISVVNFENMVDFSIDKKTKIIENAENSKEKKDIINQRYSDEFLSIINNSFISGENVRYLMEQYPNYGYLLQTNSLKQKHQNVNIYLNVGRFIKGTSTSQDKQYRIIDCSTYEEFVLLHDSIKYTDLKTESTVYYIYDTEMFKVQLLYDKDRNVVGLSFTELEV